MRLIFALLIFFALYAEVDSSPENVKIITPRYDFSSETMRPALGTYTYKVSWAAIPAAEITINLDKFGDGYKVLTEAKTLSGIDVFYKLRFKASGQMSEDFMPIKTSVFTQENSRVKKSEISFSGDYIHSTRDFIGRKREEYNFSTGNMTLDPFSVAFLARSIDWKDGEEREFDTFNGKTRYLIKFKSTGKQTIEHNGKMIECYVIQPRVQKLNPMDYNSKLKSANIFVSTDDRRDIIKIESSVFVGTVNTELVNFKEKGLDLQVAKNINLNN